LGIPILYGIDAIHGVTYTDSSTLFPQQIGLAASWDTALVRQLAEMSAYEVRASGIRWNFSPVLDIARDPRWPRFWETFGEDVKLASDFGEAMVQGYQGDAIGDAHVAACLKHFMGYSVTLSGKDRTQAWIAERQLREYFLPTFERAIDAGAMSIMINSGEINGIPVHVNKNILTDLLRNELGFEGVAVTDWEDIKYLVSRHRVAATYKDAIEMSIAAGIDMSMVPVDLEFPVLLKQLVLEGRVTEERLDLSVRRILKMKYKLGLFETGVPTIADYPKFGSDEHHDLAMKAALESIVLLKNDNLLPLSEGARILVVGDGAQSLNVLNGGWTRTWQGADPQYNTPDRATVYEALQKHSSNLQWISEQDFLSMRATPKYDCIIAVISESTYTEKPGDIEDLSIPPQSARVIDKLDYMQVPSLVLLIEGRPRVLPASIEKIQSVLLAMLPGDFGGEAIADIVFGKFNPCGKLPFTYPRYASSHTTYDHKYTDRIDTDFSQNAFDPLYTFGSGQSYTTFAYSGLQIERSELGMDDTLRVDVEVSNTGDRAGAEVVQLFVSDSVASITPSVKRLRGYRRVEMSEGSQQKVRFDIPVRELAFVGHDLKWVLEPGKFSVQIDTLVIPFTVR
jgi:beta-glucosidase